MGTKFEVNMTRESNVFVLTNIFPSESRALIVLGTYMFNPVDPAAPLLAQRLACHSLVSGNHQLPPRDLLSCFLDHGRDNVESHVIIGDHGDSFRLESNIDGLNSRLAIDGLVDGRGAAWHSACQLY